MVCAFVIAGKLCAKARRGRGVARLDRPLLILAGPGSGKTQFLVTRIWLALGTIPAEGILAVTFTRKAARELEERVKKIGAKAAQKVHKAPCAPGLGEYLAWLGLEAVAGSCRPGKSRHPLAVRQWRPL